jgi:glycosyltransferase involved in cell wall biosynthesis
MIREFRFEGDHKAPGETARRRGVWSEYLTQGDWDVIIIHAYLWQFDYSLPHLAKTKGRKILVSHGYAALQWARREKFPFGLPTLFLTTSRSLMLPFWLRRFDRAVFLSNKADFMGFYDHWLAKSSGYPGRRVIPNGVDPNVRGLDPEGFRVRHGIASGAFMLLCVANYSPRKDQGFAARAYRKAAIPGSVLVFIGSEFNEYSRAFQQEDAQHPADSNAGGIIWLEKISRVETLNAIAACDAFVLSANHEAQPISLLEAMRESKPWIAREAGCIDEMPGGLCVHTEITMADSMNRMAQDKGLRKSLGAAGRTAVETTYNLDCYTESYCRLVEELTSTR